MKRTVFFILMMIACAAWAAAQPTHYGITDPVKFRSERDLEFRDPARTPLTDDDRTKFNGLAYYPIKREFAVKATFTRNPSDSYFLMPKTGGEAERYIKTGTITFELSGREFELGVYEGETQSTDAEWIDKYGDILFIPFRDRTSGGETYGTGRYIYIPRPKSSEIVMDFNLAFNPSCAYQSKFSCPIPPKENFLDIEIRAGERNYKTVSGSKPAAESLR